MTGVGTVSSIIVAVVIGMVGLMLDRRDKRKAAERENKEHPDNSDGLRRARERVRELRKKAGSDVQP